MTLTFVYRYQPIVLVAIVLITSCIICITISKLTSRYNEGALSIKNSIATISNISIDHNDSQHNYSNNNVDGMMRVLLYNGCSGSTATYHTMKDILAAHGYNKNEKLLDELDKPEKNPFYKKAKQKLIRENSAKVEYEDIIVEAFRLLNNEAVANNKIVFSKAFYKNANILNRLNNTMFTGLLRRNPLDQEICEVKDCFRPSMKAVGYSVFAENGTKADLCYLRRYRPDVKLKTKLEVKKLIKSIRHYLSMNKYIEQTANLIPSGSLQYYEDLFAFEYTSDNRVFEESIEAWYLLVSPFITVDKRILKTVLLPMKNTRQPLAPHREIIENYE